MANSTGLTVGSHLNISSLNAIIKLESLVELETRDLPSLGSTICFRLHVL